MFILVERKLFLSKKKPRLWRELSSAAVTLPLSLHHLINYCQADLAAPIIFTRAETELKPEDRPTNYVLFKQGQ